jgi:hypothetical protein
VVSKRCSAARLPSRYILGLCNTLRLVLIRFNLCHPKF